MDYLLFLLRIIHNGPILLLQLIHNGPAPTSVMDNP